MLFNAEGSAKETILFLILFVILVGGGLYLNHTRKENAALGARGVLRKAEVIAAARDIPAGKLLTGEDFAPRRVSRSEPRAYAFGAAKEIEGKFAAAVDIPQGDQITKYLLVEREETPLSEVIGAHEAVFNVSFNESTAASVKPGYGAFLLSKDTNAVPVPVFVVKREGTVFTLRAQKKDMDAALSLALRGVLMQP
jgi:Flp pilus assembly protein CpaB